MSEQITLISEGSFISENDATNVLPESSIIDNGGDWNFDADSIRTAGGISDYFPMTWTAEEMGRIVRALVARKGRAK